MTDQTVTLRINANAQGVVTGVALAKRETESLGATGERAARQYSAGLGSATSALKSFALQAAAAFSLRGMVRMADEASNLRARLDLVTNSEAKLAAAIDQTYAIAQRTSTGLSATAELYGRMQKATDSLGRSQADALRSTDLINKTFQVSGTAAATANASIIQLAQGLGAGALRGDEFNSVLEGSPRLAQALTDSLGVNVGQLRKMAEAGELTAETIIGALLEQGEAIDAEFAQLPLTVGRAWTQIENAALAAIGNIDQEIGASGALAAGLQALVGYIEKIPRAMSLWVDAVDGAGESFDLLLGPVSDVVASISDEFLILPVSLRTAVSIIIGEFDQLRISAGEQFDLLAVAGDRAWLAMESSASALAGELEILLGGAIDAVAREYATFIDGLADGASTLGLDSIATSLRAMSSEIQTAANYEETIRAEVEASAAAYRSKGAALDATAASISETAAREITASQSAVAGSLAERDAALAQINTQRELATASTATGKAVVTANQTAGASSKEVTKALKDQAGALDQLDRIIRSLTAEVATPAQRAWMDYEDALADIAEATEVAVAASEKLGAAGEPLIAIFGRQDAAVRAATISFDANIDSIERQEAAQRRAADVVGNLLANLEEEARLASMTTEQRRVEEIVLRAVAEAQDQVNQGVAGAIALSPAMQDGLRKQVAGWYEVIDAAHQARESTQESQRAWTDFGGDLVNAMSRGMRGVKDLFRDMLRDLAAQLAQSTVLRLMASAFGGSFPGLAAAAGAGGQQSILGAMLGGNGGLGMLGGAGSIGTGLTSLISGFGALLGPLALLAGAATGDRRMGALGGAVGGFAFASSAAGAGLIGGSLAGAAGASGTILGAQLGSVVPVIGTIIGAVVGTLLAGAFEKNPLLRVRSEEFNGDRLSEGRTQSQLGDIFVRTEDLGSKAPKSQEIADQIAQFDNLIAGFLDAGQLAAVRERLSSVNDTFRDGSATMAEALDARFSAILGEMSADVQEFVGAADTLEERVQRLADGLQIERILELGELTGSFSEVGDFLAEYRQGTEDLGQTYTRLMAGTALYELALERAGTAFDGTRMELIALAADIVAEAGGLEQAAAYWNSYYETFYSESERLEIQIAQATERASQMFADAGLSLADFTGDTGAAAFREMFEDMLPTLSAEGVVEMLRLAEALGVLIDLSGQAGEAIGGVSTSLEDLMAGVTERLAEFAPALTFAERLQVIGEEMDALIASATELGASEAQLAQIRALSAAEMGAVLDEQAAAQQEYASLVRGLNDELADARGLSEYQREIRESRRWLSEMTASLNSAARAAGMQAAAEQDLAAAHEVAAIRAAQAMARLQQRGRDIVGQLYGSALEQIEAQIEAINSDVGTWASDTAGGMNEVTEATDQAVQAQISAQERIRDWLDGIMASELSGLRPKDQLTAALALFERESAAAEGGDAEAAGRLPQLADQILRLGRDVFGSSAGFFDLRDRIIDRMQDLADLVIDLPTNTGNGGGNSSGGSSGSGSSGGDIGALEVERDRLISEQAAAERMALAQSLVEVIRDMLGEQEQPLSAIEETLGFSMADLVADLGVNLSDMTVATATQLAGIASAMGVELTDLASSVGISLGGLADRQSLLNDALEAQLARLPAGQRDLLEPLLRNVEEAAALGDTAGVEEGIADMEEAILAQPPALREQLAPFFAAITPTDPVDDPGSLGSISGGIGSLVTEALASNGHLVAINTSISTLADVLIGMNTPIDPGPGGPPPGSYAVGTAYVPSDGLAYLHQGEMVFPASVSEFFRREGLPIVAPPPPPSGRSNDAGDPATAALLSAVLTAMSEQQDTLNRLVERVDRTESTLARVGDEYVRTLNRQIDRSR